MQHEFWHEKWFNNQIGFHQSEVNKILQKYWATLNISAPATVFVPFCGKSLDVVWFLSQGYGVVGAELSELALDELQQSIATELGIQLKKRLPTAQEKQAMPGMTAIYELPKQAQQKQTIRFYAGDFFDLQADWLPQIDAVYDRAAIVALPETMRPQYTKQLSQVTHQAPQLILTLQYDQEKMSGPPFSVTYEEIQRLYQSSYDVIHLLEDRELIEQEPRFAERGLTSFKQTAIQLYNNAST